MQARFGFLAFGIVFLLLLATIFAYPLRAEPAIAAITYLPLVQSRPTALAGYRMLILSNRGGPTQLYTLRIDGTGLHRLSDLPAKEPRWSPDGSQVLFVSSSPQGDDLYLVNTDGSSLRALTTMAGDEYEAVWSPNGNQILFLHDQSDSSIIELYTLALDEEATPVFISSNPSLRNARWSPKGTQIAFGADATPGDVATLQYQVFIHTPATGQTVQVTSEETGYEFLGWIQEGKQLLVAMDYADNRRDLYTLQPDGTGLQQFTTSVGLETVHAISPDGEQIAYSHKLLGNDGAELYDHAMGSNFPLLLSEPFCNTPTCGLETVAFAPDGKQLLYVTLEANSGSYNPSRLWIVREPQSTPEWNVSLMDVYHPLWVNDHTLIVHRKGESFSSFSRVPYLYNLETGSDVPLLPHDANHSVVYEVRYIP